MTSIYIMRHGLAADKTDPLYKEKDSERPLTEEGMKKVAKEVKALKKIIPELGIILTSPYKRTSQTAMIVAKARGNGEKVGILNELSPGTNYKKLFEALKNFTNKKRILLVGHDPDLSIAIGQLIGCGNISLQMKKGAVCRIDAESVSPQTDAELIWLLQPKQLLVFGGK